MSNYNPTKTPMNTNEQIALEDGVEKVNAKDFRSMVGGLIYLTHTRSDLMFTVSLSLISRFMSSPSKAYMGEAKRVL